MKQKCKTMRAKMLHAQRNKDDNENDMGTDFKSDVFYGDASTNASKYILCKDAHGDEWSRNDNYCTEQNYADANTVDLVDDDIECNTYETKVQI